MLEQGHYLVIGSPDHAWIGQVVLRLTRALDLESWPDQLQTGNSFEVLVTVAAQFVELNRLGTWLAIDGAELFLLCFWLLDKGYWSQGKMLYRLPWLVVLGQVILLYAAAEALSR